jgi:hypothetical protein
MRPAARSSFGDVIPAKIERGEFDEKKLRAMLDSAFTRKDDRALLDCKRPRSSIQQQRGE